MNGRYSSLRLRKGWHLLLFFTLILATFLGVFVQQYQSAHAATTVNINKDIEYQQIDGFGGFGAKVAWWDAKPQYDSAFLQRMVDDLGVTIIRDEMLPQTGQNPGTFDIDAVGKDSCNGGGTTMRDHMNYLKDLKAKADASGQPLKLIESVWSPPAWMKYVHCQFGTNTDWNRLIVSEIPSAENPNDHKVDYANWVVAYLKAIKQVTGIDVYAVSIQNEPAFAQGYQSAVYSPEVLANTIKVVDQTIQSNGLSTKIFMPEDVTDYNRLTGYIQWAMQDTTIRPHIPIVAVHGYGPDGITGNNSQSFWSNMNGLVSQYNVPLWMTETSGYSSDWPGAMNLAGSIYTALKYGKIDAWVWWSLGGTQADEFDLTANGNPTPLYWASKQFYRYIRPGAVMIDSTSPDPDVLVTAFKHTQQKTTSVVLINKSSSSKSITLNISGQNVPGQFTSYRSSSSENAANVGTVASNGTVNLPANSITTLYGSSSNQDSAHAPTILTQPQNVTVGEGYSTTLNVVAAGTPGLQYQWRRNGSDIPGATGSSYVHSVTTDDNGAQFTVRITNAQGSVISNAATLTVSPFNEATFSTTSSAPTIDGNASDGIWSSATSYNMGQVINNPTGMSATFQGAWDANNLYVLAKIHDPGYASGTDNVEIYLDGNNTRVPNAYVKGDWQYIFAWGSTSVSQYQGGRSGNDVAGHSIAGIQFLQVANSDNSGYQLEVKIPWSTLGISASQGKNIGFDINVAQQHTAGTTTGKVFWHSSTDDAWHDPSKFGVAKLGVSGGTTPTPTPTPNPTPTPTPTPGTTPTPNPGTGSGLKGDYYNSVDLSGNIVLSRTDATVNFDWGTGSPGTGINADNFSVRWTGQVQASSTGSYTFTTVSDDGISLWVNGQQIINNWTDHYTTTDTSAGVTLTVGQKYDIKLEYYERGNGAVAKLLWTPPGGSLVTIPQSQLFPSSSSSGTTNLALGKPVTTTGGTVCGTGEEAGKAVDGNTTSKWCQSGNANGPYTLQVDLGGSHAITGFTLYHAGSGGEQSDYNTSDYQILLSSDGSTWTPVVTITGNTSNVTTHTITSTTARYVRLSISKAQTNATFRAARLYEFQVSGS